MPGPSLIDRICASGRAYAIDAIKSAQPSIDFNYDLEPQFETIVQYIEDTFRGIHHLQNNAPEKLGQHVFKLVLGSVLGMVTAALFLAAIGSILVAFSGGPLYLAHAVIYLLSTYAGGIVSMRLLSDCDAGIRYDAMMTGFTSITA